MVKKLKKYLNEVAEEIKKVTFPSKAATKEMTTLVVVVSILTALYVSLSDFAFSSFTKWLMSK